MSSCYYPPDDAVVETSEIGMSLGGLLMHLQSSADDPTELDRCFTVLKVITRLHHDYGVQTTRPPNLHLRTVESKRDSIADWVRQIYGHVQTLRWPVKIRYGPTMTLTTNDDLFGEINDGLFAESTTSAKVTKNLAPSGSLRTFSEINNNLAPSASLTTLSDNINQSRTFGFAEDPF